MSVHPSTPNLIGSNILAIDITALAVADPSLSSSRCPIVHYLCPRNANLTTTRWKMGFHRVMSIGSGAPIPCPAGTSSSSFGLSMEEQCPDCQPGFYCPDVGTYNATVECTEGFYCPGRDAFPTRYVLRDVWRKECLLARLTCPLRRFFPTYPFPSDKRGVGNGQQLFPATRKWSKGLEVGKTLQIEVGRWSVCAWEGHVRHQTTTRPLVYIYSELPVLSSVSRRVCFHRIRICPAGHYCPAGSSNPRDCVAGTYQNDTSAANCDICPDRHYCEATATEALPCPAGYYCPEGTEFATEYPCPNGTFSNVASLASASECTLCSPGRYAS